MNDMRILVVDDSPFDRIMLCRALWQGDAKATVTLDEAVTADQAIAKVANFAYDAIFLDINLPGENGFTVLEAVRGRDDGHWPLIFVLSASRHPDHVAQAYRGKATAFLQKPADPDAGQVMAINCLNLIRDARLPHYGARVLH